MLRQLKLLRVIALLEGLSYILLLFIAVPVKYVLEDPQFVKFLGMPHGLLFIAYVIIAIMISSDLKWSKNVLFVVLIASIIPFGAFYIDKKYLRDVNT